MAPRGRALEAASRTANEVLPLYLLVEQLTERLKVREAVDLEAEIAAHPEHEFELRQVWPSLQVLAELRSADGRSSLSFPPGSGSEETRLTGVLGDYQILREIGRGGMGVVYEAEQISLGRRVALKVLPFAAMLDPRQLQRFRNEARAAAGLHHPHIVPVYAVGCERGVHYYAMQFIEGCTLAELLRDTTRSAQELPSAIAASEPSLQPPADRVSRATRDTVPLLLQRTDAAVPAPTWRTIAAWGIDAAEALDYAHHVGVVHRDIKPSNLIVDAQGAVWITDFGLAQIESDTSLTMTGDLLGTLRYMSPEQTLGTRGVVDQRTDVYSLGITLYELLARRPAFEETARVELLRQIAQHEPPPLRRCDNSIPVELETIVQKALSKDPAARYATAQELADDLRRFLDDRPIHARRPRVVERIRKWARRRRTLVRSLTVGALVSAAGLAAAALVVVRARHQTEMQRWALQTERAAGEAAAQFARANQYVSRINLADRALRRGLVGEGRTHLAACVPEPWDVDLRGFEWRYLSRLTTPELQEIGRHEGPAYGVQISPDGRLIASCGSDGVRIWDAASGSQLRRLTAHRGDVNRPCFSPDGRWLVTTSEDGSAIVWRIADWSIVATLAHYGMAGGGEFTADGSILYTTDYHVPTGPHIGESCGRAWDARTWEAIDEFQWHAGTIKAGDVSDDGRMWAGSYESNEVIVSDLPQRTPRCTFPFVEGGPIWHWVSWVTCLRFAHQNPWLVAGTGGGALALFHTQDGTPLFRWNGPPSRVSSAAFSLDDALLVTGGWGGAQAWTLTSTGGYTGITAVETGHTVWHVCLLDTDSAILADDSGRILRWSISGAPFRQFIRVEESNLSTAVLPDGRLVVGGGSRLAVYRLENLVEQTSVPVRDGPIEHMVLTPDGKMLVTGGPDNGKLTCWDTESWQPVCTIQTAAAPLTALQLHRDGRVLVAESRKSGRLNWHDRDWFELPGGRLLVDIAPDSAQVLMEPSSELFIEYHSDGTQLRNGPEVSWRHPLPDVAGVAFSADGRYVAIAQRDQMIEIRDTGTGRVEATCVGAADAPALMAFSPDGRTLACAAGGGSCTLFQVDTWRELLTIDSGLSAMTAIQFDPQGAALVITGRRADRGEIVVLRTGD